MEMIWIWLAIVAVSLVVEFLSWDLTSVWFAVAGLVSLILSAIDGICWEIQLAVFIVLSALLLIFVRSICRKLLLKNANTKTNVDSLVGRKLKLLKTITKDDMGEVKINGVIWSAVAEDDEIINAGSEVEILRVEGNKTIVKLTQTPQAREKTFETQIANTETPETADSRAVATKTNEPQASETPAAEPEETPVEQPTNKDQ